LYKEHVKRPLQSDGFRGTTPFGRLAIKSFRNEVEVLLEKIAITPARETQLSFDQFNVKNALDTFLPSFHPSFHPSILPSCYT